MKNPTTNPLQKLQARRAATLKQLAAIDAAIKAESKKMKEATQREALAVLQKSGVLDDPDRLTELLSKLTADRRNEAKPSPAKPAVDVSAPTGGDTAKPARGGADAQL